MEDIDQHNLQNADLVSAGRDPEDFRSTTDRMVYQNQRQAYRISHHEGFMEQALPSQYHATMKVASQIPPTSLRGIQHNIQKTEQATRLIQSYSVFKQEGLQEDMVDEDLDAILDSDKAIADNLETIENDIFEIEEIKLCNLTKRVTDIVQGAKYSLIYSREIPTRSMEIQATPFNKDKSSDQVSWLRFNIMQAQNSLVITVVAKAELKDPHFVYELTIDKDSYLELQKNQSIHTSFNDFAKRLATLLDYCVLQLHNQTELKSRFSCVFNEGKDDPDSQTMYICEQNEFRHLIHLQLDFKRMSPQDQSRVHWTQNMINASLFQNYLKQKMVLIQNKRDNCNAMLGVREDLGLLREENEKLNEETRVKHNQQIESMDEERQQQLAETTNSYEAAIEKLVEDHKEELANLRGENQNLTEDLREAEQTLEKEQLEKTHMHKELARLGDSTENQDSDIFEMRTKIEQQSTKITELEKDKLTQGHDIERKTANIDSLESQLKELKELHTKESTELQQLKLDHTKLDQKSIGQDETIEQLRRDIENLNSSLDSQKQETTKYKDKKIALKESLSQSQAEVASLKNQIADLQKKLEDSENGCKDRDEVISNKLEAIELLQTKLKETQATLLSNNTTIDELKNSLAEAQKYSFRAILNNRNSTHHPTANAATTVLPSQQQPSMGGQQSLSQYLRANDTRVASTSPYRSGGQAQTMPMSANKANQFETQNQPIFSQVHQLKAVNQSRTLSGPDIGITKGETIQHGEDKVEAPSGATNQYTASQHVKMPLTDYYVNKFGGPGGQNVSNTFNQATYSNQKPDDEPSVVNNFGNENQFMLQAQQQMLKSKAPTLRDLRPSYNEQSMGMSGSNQFVQKLERDKIQSHYRNFDQTRGTNPMLTRVESKQSAMFGATREHRASQQSSQLRSHQDSQNDFRAAQNAEMDMLMTSQASFAAAQESMGYQGQTMNDRVDLDETPHDYTPPKQVHGQD